MFFELRQHEIQKHRLAGTRWAANERVAKITVMEIEIVGRAGCSFQKGYCSAPFIAVFLTDRIRMERRERCKIA